MKKSEEIEDVFYKAIIAMTQEVTLSSDSVFESSHEVKDVTQAILNLAQAKAMLLEGNSDE